MSELQKEKRGYEFFTIPRLNIDACKEYTDIGAMGFMMVSWLSEFYEPVRLALSDGSDPLAVSKHRTYSYEGRIYLQISSSLAINQFSAFGLDTPYKVHYLLDKLANPSCGKPLIKIHLFGDKVARCSLRAIYPTEHLTRLVVNNTHIEKNEQYDNDEEPPTPPEPEEEYAPSKEFLQFVEDTKDIPALAKCNVKKLRGDGYTKDAMNADKILKTFLEGSVIAHYGTNFTRKVTQAQLDTMTYEDIVKCVHNYTYAQAPSFATALMHFDRKYSPVINQYLKEVPKDKTVPSKKVDPTKLPAELRIFYGGTYSEGTRIGINDRIMNKAGQEKFYTHFKPYDERFFNLYGKFAEYIDDMGEALKKINTKRVTPLTLLNSYVKMLKSQTDPYVETTLENDLEYMAMGNSKNDNFKRFAIYACMQEGIYISFNEGLNSWLRKQMRGKEVASMGDVIKASMSVRDLEY